MTHTSMFRPAAAIPKHTCCQFTVTAPTADARRATQSPSFLPGSGLVEVTAGRIGETSAACCRNREAGVAIPRA